MNNSGADQTKDLQAGLLLCYLYTTKSVFVMTRHTISTPGRQQSKSLLTIHECGSKIAVFSINSVFNCHLSPVGQQMAIKNSVSKDFWSTFVDSIDVFNSCLPSVISL